MSFLTWITIIYELVRIVFIILARPEFTVQMLPLSWFVATPLLVFPIIFILLLLEAPKTFVFLYCLSKSMQFFGSVSYIIRDYPFAIIYGSTNNYYSLRNLLWLVLFLIFDVILCVVVWRKYHPTRKKTEVSLPETVNSNAENDDN